MTAAGRVSAIVGIGRPEGRITKVKPAESGESAVLSMRNAGAGLPIVLSRYEPSLEIAGAKR